MQRGVFHFVQMFEFFSFCDISYNNVTHKYITMSQATPQTEKKNKQKKATKHINLFVYGHSAIQICYPGLLFGTLRGKGTANTFPETF